jgi:hypothetical protein
VHADGDRLPLPAAAAFAAAAIGTLALVAAVVVHMAYGACTLPLFGIAWIPFLLWRGGSLTLVSGGCALFVVGAGFLMTDMGGLFYWPAAAALAVSAIADRSTGRSARPG